MSHKEIIKKIENGELGANNKMKTSKSNLSESHLKDSQNNVRNLYKKEMDIIFEGFSNI